MNNLEQAAWDALELWEQIIEGKGKRIWSLSDLREVCTSLRGALSEQAEPVAWVGYDLDQMVEAFSRVIEAHHYSKHPFHNPIDTDAKVALRILRGFIPSMKAYAAPQQAEPVWELGVAGRLSAEATALARREAAAKPESDHATKNSGDDAGRDSSPEFA